MVCIRVQVRVKVASSHGQRRRRVCALGDLGTHPTDGLEVPTGLEGHAARVKLDAVSNVSMSTKDKNRSVRVNGADGVEDKRPIVPKGTGSLMRAHG